MRKDHQATLSSHATTVLITSSFLILSLATDIADKELQGLRKNRWNVAFSEQAALENDQDRKATIVVEHLIQASDVR